MKSHLTLFTLLLLTPMLGYSWSVPHGDYNCGKTEIHITPYSAYLGDTAKETPTPVGSTLDNTGNWIFGYRHSQDRNNMSQSNYKVFNSSYGVTFVIENQVSFLPSQSTRDFESFDYQIIMMTLYQSGDQFRLDHKNLLTQGVPKTEEVTVDDYQPLKFKNLSKDGSEVCSFNPAQ